MRAVRTGGRQFGTAFAAIGVSMALAVGPALSQPKPPTPQPPAADIDFIVDAIETCGEAIDNDFDTGANNLIAAGWALEDPFDNGRFLDEIAGQKDYGAAGIAYYYASLEYYADTTIGYCEYEVDIPGVPIDLNLLTTEYGFDGEVETGPDAMFGAWTVVDGDVTYYVLASVNPDLYHFQVTWILGSSGPPNTAK